MRTRRWFTAEFKEKTALNAQDIAAKHQVHPNRVGARKRQALDGLSAVFSNWAEASRRDHEAEIKELHAKIGQLTVERDFLSRGLKR